MKESEKPSGYDWDAWFWLDSEEFDGEWKIGQCRYRVEKAVGRGNDGKLFLMVWTNHDKYDHKKFTRKFYDIGREEYVSLLDRAIAQGSVEPGEREKLIGKADSPFIPPWDIHKALVVYRDGKYTLGQKNDRPYLAVGGEEYILSCHPYEPCLYITGRDGGMTAVHNAFDPFDVLESFANGGKITSITGVEYEAKDFCRLVEAAADAYDIQIDEAERLAFGDRTGRMKPERKQKKEEPAAGGKPFRPEAGTVIDDDPFYGVIAEYPDSVVDFCLVKNEDSRGYNAHWYALLWAVRRLFFDEDVEPEWRFDVAEAEGKKIGTEALFAPVDRHGGMNYRKAFLEPPHTNGYTDADFDRINSSLFPNGTEELEVYEWTTDWTDYFDEGREWWGTLCLTVYDKTLDRFAVIMASATD